MTTILAFWGESDRQGQGWGHWRMRGERGTLWSSLRVRPRSHHTVSSAPWTVATSFLKILFFNRKYIHTVHNSKGTWGCTVKRLPPAPQLSLQKPLVSPCTEMFYGCISIRAYLRARELLSFLVPIKVVFMLHCSLLTVQ